MPAGSLVEAPAAGEPGETVAPAVYRPHLDGLRAVAVYLVVLFHAGSAAFSGGYVGVDVFFVLSGFLVTQLLLRDLTTRGSIRLGRFYSRRFRRLLPAAFVALIVTAVVFTAIATPSEVADSLGSFKAAFLYSANWYFIHQSRGYFGADIARNPVLQFWSLAVEEQFYLVWPLALGGLFLLARRLDPRRRMPAIRLAVAVGAVASAAWALSLHTSNPDRAYYGADARAYELLAGASIALVPAFVAAATRYRRSMRVATVGSVVALLIVASDWIHLDAIERGIAVTIVSCVLIVAIEAADGGIVKRVLSSNPVVYLGKISYGTYLWHWLVILVALTTVHISSLAMIGVASLVATALASLSYEILEQPVRTSALLDRHRRTVIATGLVISVVSALVIIPRIVDPDRASASAVLGQRSSATGTPVPKNLDLLNVRKRELAAPFPLCLGKPASACTIVHGTGRHVMLIGDSHAWMMIPAFVRLARQENLTLSVSTWAACPWQRDLYTTIERSKCKQITDDLYERVIPELHPDVIALMEISYGSRGPYSALYDSQGKRLDFATIASKTRASVAELRARANDILLMEPVPLPPFRYNPVTCLERATVIQQCRYRIDSSPIPLEGLFRQLAARDPKIDTLNLDRAVCPHLPVCDTVVNGRLVRWDVSHLTAPFAQTLAPEIGVELRRAGNLGR